MQGFKTLNFITSQCPLHAILSVRATPKLLGTGPIIVERQVQSTGAGALYMRFLKI